MSEVCSDVRAVLVQCSVSVIPLFGRGVMWYGCSFRGCFCYTEWFQPQVIQRIQYFSHWHFFFHPLPVLSNLVLFLFS